MLLKTSTSAVCHANPSVTLSLGARSRWTSPSRCISPLERRDRRTYATVRNGDPPRSSGSEDRQWSDHQNTLHGDLPSWPKSAHPTPYEIFDIRKGTPYTKTRFYQLVKLYHPDTTDHGASRIPHAVRLERYHLLIAANDLLSDPSKRQLYDSQGIGWPGSGAGRTSSWTRESARHADRSWHRQPGTAAHNATWEDWERWYESRAGGEMAARARAARARSVHMPNSVFAAVVVMMCMVGALAQKTRAESSGTSYVEWRAQRNGEIGDDMRRSSAAMARHSKDQRIETFVRDRENVAYEYLPRKDDRVPPDHRLE